MSLLRILCVALGRSPLSHHGFQPGGCKGPPEFRARPAPSLWPAWGSVWVNTTGRYKHSGVSDLDLRIPEPQPWPVSSFLLQPHEAGAAHARRADEETEAREAGRPQCFAATGLPPTLADRWARGPAPHAEAASWGPRGRRVWPPRLPTGAQGLIDSQGHFSE